MKRFLHLLAVAIFLLSLIATEANTFCKAVDTMTNVERVEKEDLDKEKKSDDTEGEEESPVEKDTEKENKALHAYTHLKTYFSQPTVLILVGTVFADVYHLHSHQQGDIETPPPDFI